MGEMIRNKCLSDTLEHLCLYKTVISRVELKSLLFHEAFLALSTTAVIHLASDNIICITCCPVFCELMFVKCLNSVGT